MPTGIFLANFFLGGGGGGGGGGFFFLACTAFLGGVDARLPKYTGRMFKFRAWDRQQSVTVEERKEKLGTVVSNYDHIIV